MLHTCMQFRTRVWEHAGDICWSKAPTHACVCVCVCLCLCLSVCLSVCLFVCAAYMIFGDPKHLHTAVRMWVWRRLHLYLFFTKNRYKCFTKNRYKCTRLCTKNRYKCTRRARKIDTNASAATLTYAPRWLKEKCAPRARTTLLWLRTCF